MSNESLTDGVTYPMRRIAEKLRAQAARIDARADDLTANPAHRHGQVAAETVADLMVLMANLNLYNMIDNAAYAARDWVEPTTEVTVTLTGVDPDQAIPTVREVRQIHATMTGKSMSLVDGRDMVFTIAGRPFERSSQSAAVPSRTVVSGVSQEQAEIARRLLARLGATVEISPAK